MEKLDPFGFMSPIVLHRFSEYMHKHRVQADGSLRDSDNWKKGMPIMEYVRSLVRHTMDFWMVMSGFAPRFDTHTADPEEIACAILFNVQGFLHEVLSQKVDAGFSHGLRMNPEFQQVVKEQGPGLIKKTGSWS